MAKFGEIVGKPGPVQLDCAVEPNEFGDEYGPVYFDCNWQVEPDVIQAVLDCPLTREKVVLSRNMDDYRSKYDWRITRFDRETGEPAGHSYGKTPKDALKPLEPWDKCELVSVKRRAAKAASLGALPKTGRISLATAKRALKLLPPGRQACKITAANLRDGLEVEREHRDVTRLGLKKTALIAASHLCESPRYYTELKKLERRLKRSKK